MSCFPLGLSSPADLQWYAVRTKSNREKSVSSLLEARGLQPYLPLYRTRRQWSDRTVETSLPLFSGYVFCRFDARVSSSVLCNPGVVSVVGFGGKPASIPEAEINAIENVLRSGLLAEPCPYLCEGQRIRLQRGPLAGLEGILVQKKSNWRVVVSVEMLQRSLAVEVDPQSIAAL